MPGNEGDSNALTPAPLPEGEGDQTVPASPRPRVSLLPAPCSPLPAFVPPSWRRDLSREIDSSKRRRGSTATTISPRT